MAGSPYFIYIVLCSDNTYYTGVTNNLEKRVRAHNGALQNGAKYTKTRRPVTLKYFELHKNESEAKKREYAIKKLSRKEKEALTKKNIATPP